MTQDVAESIAISALSFIASDPVELDRFLGATGLDPAGLREAAGEAGFLGGVLEHVCADEMLLVAFAAGQDLAPEAVAAARLALVGPPVEDW